MTASELRQLLDQYLADTISEDDFRKLWATLKQERFNKEWYRFSETFLENESIHGLSDDQGKKAAWQKLKEKIAEEQQDSVSGEPLICERIPLRRRWFSYAAAIVAIGFLAYYLYTVRPGDSVTAPAALAVAENDVLPGSNTAVLTLSNGLQVQLAGGYEELNDAGVTIKKSDGQLTYDRSSISGVNTMSTPRGGQYRLTLSDGTRVWLNAASSLTYPTAFTGDTRRVSITGEAYFEVAKDATKSFIVVSRNAEIQALGTSFNVNSYDDEPTATTTLVEGSVKVNGDLLQPGEAWCDGDIAKANTDAAISWTMGVFNFHKMNIDVVMRQLARWYDVDVIYEEEFGKLVFGGKMERNLTLAQTMRGFENMGIHFRIEGRKIYISK